MRALTRTAATPVFAALMFFTALQGWLGLEDGMLSVKATAVFLMVVAFVKIGFIGMYFQELRHAPTWLSRAFTGWCTVVCAAMILMYLLR